MGHGFHDKFRLLTQKGKEVLDEERFRACDFWLGYKLYCYARYSECQRSLRRFMATKMARVVAALNKENHIPWGSVFDEAIRQTWAEMEEYGEIIHGQDWTNLRELMEEFDDVKELSASVNGSLLMKVVEDDEHGTESLHRRNLSVEVQSTDILDEVRGRLNRVRLDLENLKRSCGESSEGLRNKKVKRSIVVVTCGEDVGNK